MTRDEFIDFLSEEFLEDFDNNRLNRILEAADEYVENEKAQLSQKDAISDTISRQAAIDAAKDWYDGLICGSFNGLEKRIKALPSAQLEVSGRLTPKPPIAEYDGYADGYPEWEYSCPSCDAPLGYFGDCKFCPECGQAILWEVNENDSN